MTDHKAEILAPCGSTEAVYAAVRCRADAVYLGTKDFNARRNATNFSYDELKEIISYCHLHNVKVHITLNIIVFDSEIEAVKNTIRRICSLGADVLILQDLGVIKIAKALAPELELHASTQMSVQTSYGIELLKSLGLTTAVLPRELSKEEIEKIHSRTQMRLEAFVHGALCMCVSGQCYMSAMFGSRSGNRGLCAQPCRLPFCAKGGTGHDLSLKDLSLINKAEELVSLGVSSLKIEGRMKRPEYVAASVTTLSNELSGNIDESISSALTAIFSRSGFTDGYFENKRGSVMFGTRRKEDVVSADSKTISMLANLYAKEQPSRAVDFSISIKADSPLCLYAQCDNVQVSASSDIYPAAAINKATTVEAITEKIAKCGGTAFYPNIINVEIQEGLAVPASAINALRREILEKLTACFSEAKEKAFVDADISNFSVKEIPHASTPQFIYRFDNAEQIPQNINAKVIIRLDEVAEAIKKMPANKIIAEIPRGIFGQDDDILNKLKKAKSIGVELCCAQTLDGIALAKKADLHFITGFSLNTANSIAQNEVEKLGAKATTISPELTLGQISKIKASVPKMIIAYGRLPLMLTRNCPIKNGKTCAECKRNSSLTDRKGIDFPVRCTNNCSEVLNSAPIYLADRINELKGIDYAILYFTTESKAEAEQIIQSYKKQSAPVNDYTRGLYYRGVQ